MQITEPGRLLSLARTARESADRVPVAVWFTLNSGCKLGRAKPSGIQEVSVCLSYESTVVAALAAGTAASCLMGNS